jgi:RsiW-degrading membrane proteinase PrsW (M82 family)
LDFTGCRQTVIFEGMFLLALAIAPGIAICLFIYYKDRYDREPKKYLAVSFLLGMLSTFPALLVQFLAGDVRENATSHFIATYAFFAYIIVALSEEGSKFLMLRLYAYPKKSFNEPFDGIVYAVMVAMGFATVENIEYVLHYGVQTGVIRFFLSVPAHASFAVLMGYYTGRAKFNPRWSFWLMAKGLLIAVFFHGSFDFCIFLQDNEHVTRYISTGMLSFGAFASFYISFRLAMRSLRSQQSISRKAFENNHFAD